MPIKTNTPYFNYDGTNIYGGLPITVIWCWLYRSGAFRHGK